MVDTKQTDVEGIAVDRLSPSARPLKMLNTGQVAQIDRLLAEIGPYGEIRLIKVKGRLRFIQRVESVEAM